MEQYRCQPRAERLVVRYLSLRKLPGKRERLKILSRHARINQPVHRSEPETPIVLGLAQQHTACCTHAFKRSKSAFHQHRTDASPLILRKNGYRTKPKPAGSTA